MTMICEGFLWCKLKNIGVFIHLIDLISSRKKHREQINVKDSKDHENNANSPSETRWGETHQKRERERGERETRASLAHNGSHSGNGLLHLIHTLSGELEHWGDRGLRGELEFLKAFVSVMHLSHNHNQNDENERSASLAHKDKYIKLLPSDMYRRYQGEFPGQAFPR